MTQTASTGPLLPIAATLLTLATAPGQGGVLYFGKGCMGSNQLTPSLDHTGSTGLGQRLTMRVANAAGTGNVLFVFGLSRTNVDLFRFGAPGCTLYPHVGAMFPAAASGGQASIALSIPKDPNLVGAKFYSQGASIDPRANPMGIALTRGAEGTIGKPAITVRQWGPTVGQKGTIVRFVGQFGTQNALDLCVGSRDATGRFTLLRPVRIYPRGSEQVLETKVVGVPSGFTGGRVMLWRGSGGTTKLAPRRWLRPPQWTWYWNGKARVGDTFRTIAQFHATASGCPQGTVEYVANEIKITLPHNPCPPLRYPVGTEVTIDLHWDTDDGTHWDFLEEAMYTVPAATTCFTVAGELASPTAPKGYLTQQLELPHYGGRFQIRIDYLASPCPVIYIKAAPGTPKITAASGNIWACCPGT